jgi:hypothetical protein
MNAEFNGSSAVKGDGTVNILVKDNRSLIDRIINRKALHVVLNGQTRISLKNTIAFSEFPKE